MKRSRLMRLIAAFGAVALLATACGGSDDGGGDDTAADDGGGDDTADDGGGDDGGMAGDTIGDNYDLSGISYSVGSKDFTEQLVLGHITRFALEAAGADVQDNVGLAGTAAARDALTSGEIDMYWEYNGTGWGIHLNNELGPENIPDNLTEEVASRDLEQNGIRWLEAANFNNTYALAVRDEIAGEVPMSLSEVAESMDGSDDFTLCIESEFSTREDSLPGMEAFYGFDWPDDLISIVDTGVVYTQTDSGDCNYGEVFTSDGRIAALGLTIVEDDQNFFPPYNPSVTIRDEKYQEAPEVADLFAEIANSLDLETMQELNASVDVDGEFPEDVAEQWLKDNGFIS